LVHPAVWPQQIWAENGGAAPLWGSSVFIYHIVAGDEAYLHVKFHLYPCNRLATIHQRYRQDRQRSDSIAQTVFTNRRPKIISTFSNESVSII